MRKETHRDTVVKTKLTTGEKEKLDDLCQRTGLSYSSFIRQAVFTGKIISGASSGPADERVLEGIGEIFRSLAGIREVLEQVLEELKGAGGPDGELSLLLRKGLSELNENEYRLLKLLGDAYGHHKTPGL